MQIGDPIKVTGTVKDIVHAKDTNIVSILMQSDDLPGAPGREFWFPEGQVQDNPPPQTATATAPATEHAAKHAAEPAPKHTPAPHVAHGS
jgi:hypothetical protein